MLRVLMMVVLIVFGIVNELVVCLDYFGCFLVFVVVLPDFGLLVI